MRASRLSGKEESHSPGSNRPKKGSKPRKQKVSIEKVDESSFEQENPFDKAADYDSTDQRRGRTTHFTPGKIRAAKHPNNYMSPSTQG